MEDFNGELDRNVPAVSDLCLLSLRGFASRVLST